MASQDEFARLTQRIYRLEQEVTELRKQAGMAARPAPRRGGKAAEPQAQADPFVAEPVPAMSATRSPAPVPAEIRSPARSPLISTAKREGIDEANLVGTWFARAGMLGILIGAGFAFKYAVDRGFIGPTARVVLGIVVGLAFIGWGEVVFRRGWRLFSQAVSGGGIALLYLSVLSAQHLFDLIPAGAAFVALVAVSCLGAGVAYRQNALALAVFTTVGAFLNPFLVGASDLDPVAFLGYVAAVDLFVLFVAGKLWSALDRVALIGTIFVVLVVTPEMSFEQRVGYTTLLFAMFAAIPFARHWMSETKDRNVTDIDIVIGSSAAYYAYVMWVLDANHDGWQGLYTLGMAALYALGAVLGRIGRLNAETKWMAWVSLGLMVLFVPIQYDGPWIGAGWVIEGLVLLAIEVKRPDAYRIRIPAEVLIWVGAMACVIAAAAAYPPDKLLVSAESGGLIIAIAALAATGILSDLLPKHTNDLGLGSGRAMWFFGANAVALMWLSIELAAELTRQYPVDPQQSVQFGLTILWGMYAAALLLGGFVARARWARMCGVSLFVLVIVKVVVADVWFLQTPYRIVVFLGLGALLLVCSVMYQRFRELLMADDPDPEPELPPVPPSSPDLKPKPKRPAPKRKPAAPRARKV